VDQLLDVVQELDGERREEASVQNQGAVEAG
jgi:hypothetical protein